MAGTARTPSADVGVTSTGLPPAPAWFDRRRGVPAAPDWFGRGRVPPPLPPETAASGARADCVRDVPAAPPPLPAGTGSGSCETGRTGRRWMRVLLPGLGALSVAAAAVFAVWSAFPEQPPAWEVLRTAQTRHAEPVAARRPADVGERPAQRVGPVAAVRPAGRAAVARAQQAAGEPVPIAAASRPAAVVAVAPVRKVEPPARGSAAAVATSPVAVSHLTQVCTPDTCGDLPRLGTALHWVADTNAAAKLAKQQGKLVFVIQVSGNFAREEFT